MLSDDLAEREPALAELTAASVCGLLPAGPERRTRPAITLATRGALAITGPLTATELGFSLHAATAVDGDDQPGREALCRYVLRPPLAHEHLERLSDELVRIHLRTPSPTAPPLWISIRCRCSCGWQPRCPPLFSTRFVTLVCLRRPPNGARSSFRRPSHAAKSPSGTRGLASRRPTARAGGHGTSS